MIKRPGNPAPANELKKIIVGGNVDLEEISLIYCPELTEIAAPGSKKLDKVWGLDKLKKLGSVVLEGNITDYIHKEKLQHLEKIKKVAKKLAGVAPGGKLDTTNLADLESKIVAGGK